MNDTLRKQRNIGIDLLRIISMFLVVILHVLGCGGILNNTESYSLNYYVAWFIETSAYCAVDVFAMISGYVMVNTKINIFKIIPLWLIVFFYSIIIILLFNFIPSFSSIYVISKKEIIKSIFIPVLSNQYWYFSSYFALFFFIPFVNILLNKLNKQSFAFLCLFIILFFSLSPILTLNRIDSFHMNSGYSTAWLLCLYIIGAYIKIFPIHLSKIKCILIYFSCIIISWASKFFSHILIKVIFHKNTELDLFIEYTSIFIIISSISLLLFFSQFKIQSIRLRKIITFFGNLSFSVYIIHSNPFIFNYILKDRFINISNESPIFLFLKTLLISFLIFFFCLLIDIIRFLLFKFLGINKLPQILYNKLNKQIGLE